MMQNTFSMVTADVAARSFSANWIPTPCNGWSWMSRCRTEKFSLTSFTYANVISAKLV